MKEIECTSYLLLVSTTDEPYTPVSTQRSENLEEYFIPPEANNIDVNDRLFEGNVVVEYVQQ